MVSVVEIALQLVSLGRSIGDQLRRQIGAVAGASACYRRRKPAARNAIPAPRTSMIRATITQGALPIIPPIIPPINRIGSSTTTSSATPRAMRTMRVVSFIVRTRISCIAVGSAGGRSVQRSIGCSTCRTTILPVWPMCRDLGTTSAMATKVPPCATCARASAASPDQDIDVKGFQLDTIASLDAAGIAHTGAGPNLTTARRPAIVEAAGCAWA
jgi:Bacterial capsule synthesis protein PGA_cap